MGCACCKAGQELETARQELQRQQALIAQQNARLGQLDQQAAHIKQLEDLHSVNGHALEILQRQCRATEAQVQAEERALREQIRAAEARAAELQAAIGERDRKIGELQQEISVLDTERQGEQEKARAYREQSRAEAQAAELQRAGLQSAIHEQERKIAQLQQEVSALGRERQGEQVKARAQSLAAEAKAAELQSTVVQLQGAIAEGDRKIGERDLTIAQLQQKVSALGKDLNQQKEVRLEAAAASEKRRQRVAVLESQLDQRALKPCHGGSPAKAKERPASLRDLLGQWEERAIPAPSWECEQCDNAWNPLSQEGNRALAAGYKDGKQVIEYQCGDCRFLVDLAAGEQTNRQTDARAKLRISTPPAAVTLCGPGAPMTLSPKERRAELRWLVGRCAASPDNPVQLLLVHALAHGFETVCIRGELRSGLQVILRAIELAPAWGRLYHHLALELELTGQQNNCCSLRNGRIITAAEAHKEAERLEPGCALFLQGYSETGCALILQHNLPKGLQLAHFKPRGPVTFGEVQHLVGFLENEQCPTTLEKALEPLLRPEHDREAFEIAIRDSSANPVTRVGLEADLSPLHRAAIASYTLESPFALYKLLNAPLHRAGSATPADLQPCRPYLRLLLEALRALPFCHDPSTELYRGVAVPANSDSYLLTLRDDPQQFVRRVLTFAAPTSTTTDYHKAKAHTRGNGVVFVLRGIPRAKRISSLSCHQLEDEVLIEPPCSVRVDSFECEDCVKIYATATECSVSYF
eukprot:TRINITY_DN10794_c0_g1_i2.p1 TRINITY_DN10794_c0_g1~~TRINITY_DN10794_c0_g1_i2.p1  ORF type:complete len:763 (+),score=132.83 TRINITY_DN10794_c0_g1_i2:23-2290(+)